MTDDRRHEEHPRRRWAELTGAERVWRIVCVAWQWPLAFLVERWHGISLLRLLSIASFALAWHDVEALHGQTPAGHLGWIHLALIALAIVTACGVKLIEKGMDAFIGIARVKAGLSQTPPAP